MLIPDHTCNPPSGNYMFERFGISKNRALATCNKTLCAFTLGYPDYVSLGANVNNPEAVGNYVNDDIFIGNYDGGKYYKNGQKLWELDGKIQHVSMSPGGRFIAIAYDPYGIDVLDASGQKLVSKKSSATGIEATERGIFYATHSGTNLTLYRLSTMSEPVSSTTTSAGGGSTHFMDQFFQGLVDMFNAAINWLKGLFS
jgi:hypothetical protein